jgi:maltooligosyltrehalose trehalohydrolase
VSARDDFHHALHALITGERSGYYEDFGSLDHLMTALRQAFVYAGSWSRHRRRVHGRTASGIPGWRFVVSAQNHDQVGNRARGERLAHLTSPGRAKVAAALLLCAPFVPMLFQGEEWGASTPFQYFTSHADTELGRQVSDGRRREFAVFGWDPDGVPDPQAPSTFERSRLRWAERRDPIHRDLLEWYEALIALRRDRAALRDGDCPSVRVDRVMGDEAFVMRRGDIAVACNLSGCDVPFSLDGQVLLASDQVLAADGLLHLPADAVAILELTSGERVG